MSIADSDVSIGFGNCIIVGALNGQHFFTCLDGLLVPALQTIHVALAYQGTGYPFLVPLSREVSLGAFIVRQRLVPFSQPGLNSRPMEAQHRPGSEQVTGQGIYPREEGCPAARLVSLGSNGLDSPPGIRPILGLQVMGDGLLPGLPFFQELASPAVQLDEAVLAAPPQPGLQEFPEKVVVTIPPFAPLQTNDEQVALHQQVEHLLGVVYVQQGVTQGGVQLIEDGRGDQELLYFGWLQSEDLAGQIVVHPAAGSRRLHNAGQELLPHRLRGEYDAGDPPVRVLSEFLGRIGGQVEVIVLFDQSPYLVAGKTQVLSAQADHLLAGSETYQRQTTGDSPAGDDEVTVFGRMGQQSVQEIVDDGTGLHQVIVVQNDDEILRDGLVNFIDYGGDEGIHSLPVELRGIA